MCGFVCLVDLGGNSREQLNAATVMTQTLRHRGPDDEGYAVFPRDGEPIMFYGSDTPMKVRDAYPSMRATKGCPAADAIVTFGHRRLSILDLSSAGHQPMASTDGRYWIVFNGEIYNYVELRDELRRHGHDFRSSTDTEVILAAYRQWGSAAVSRFNGDWAFVILDRAEETLFVSRDRFGIKPLYYAQSGTMLAFASEIKALVAHPRLDVAPNEAYLRNYLARGATEWATDTAFSGISRFPFGHSARINLRTTNTLSMRPERYWYVEPNDSREPFQRKRALALADEYYALLKDAVRVRLRSDVPVGCALSGGLDSSSIVYLVREILGEQGRNAPVRTFSLIHREKASRYCDESKYIYLLRDALGLDASVVEPDPARIPALSDDVARHWECPPDGMGMAGMFTVGLAKDRGFVVTLDGQGADEHLAGYDSYIPSFLGGLPAWRFPIEAILLANNFGWSGAMVKKLLVACASRMPPGAAKRLAGGLGYGEFKGVNPSLNANLLASIENGLVNLLHYADSRAMYYSIESRMPFMDHRLVAFNLATPQNFKIHNGFTKYYARLAFDGRLPRAIVWRRDKMGWPLPDRVWLGTCLRAWYEGLVDRSSLLKLLDGPNSDVPLTTAQKVRALSVAQFENVFFACGRHVAP